MRDPVSDVRNASSHGKYAQAEILYAYTMSGFITGAYQNPGRARITQQKRKPMAAISTLNVSQRVNEIRRQLPPIDPPATSQPPVQAGRFASNFQSAAKVVSRVIIRTPVPWRMVWRTTGGEY